MKNKSIFLSIIILGIIYSTVSTAQEMGKGLDLSFVAGLDIGATTPVPIPDDLDITGYNPKLNPKLGANLVYYFTEKFGIGTGLTVDWKGMTVRTKVTDVHLSIDAPNIGLLTGYVTGRNKTKVNTLYLTQPVYGVYRFNPKWNTKAGIYLAEALSRKFHGNVRDVDILVESPISQERAITYATLNYYKHVHKLDVGLLLGGEFRMNDHIGFFTDFTRAFTPYFSNDVPIHFTMRNIYLSLGMTYRIK